MSAEQAVGIAVGALLLGAFLLLLLLLSGGGAKPVKQPVVQPVKDPVDEQVIEYQRAKYFTGEETEALAATAVGPAIVAGQDLDDSLLIAELQQAYARYRAGEDVYAGAPKESV